MRGRYEDRTKPFEPDVDGPRRARAAARYKVFIPEPIANFEVNISLSTHGYISQVEALIRNLDGNTKLNLLTHYLMRSESIASSQIEGLKIAPGDLIRAEAKNSRGIKIGEVAQEVLANIDSMTKAIELASSSSELTVSDIHQIHYELMKDSHISNEAGKFRKVQNFIGKTNHIVDAEFIPAPPELVPELMEDLVAAINSPDLSPLVVAAIAHGQFETIHPYVDGNGRTGRALVHVILKRRGLAQTLITPISIALWKNRERYISGLEKFRRGEILDWLEFFASSAHQATDLAKKYLAEVEKIQSRWHNLIEERFAPRTDAAIWNIADTLISRPFTDIPQLINLSGKSKNAVSPAVEQLVELGILSLDRQHSRNRSWVAQEVMDVLEKLN
jgi:Fic family protein